MGAALDVARVPVFMRVPGGRPDVDAAPRQWILLESEWFAAGIEEDRYTRAVPAVGPTRGGLFIHLMPPFAAVLGMIFLDERLETFHLIGAAAIFAGLYLTTMPGRRARSTET